VNLREARLAREWSQSRLVSAIEIYAKQRGLPIASTASLSVYVSEWENERRTVSESYARILRAVLGMTNTELFGTDSETAGSGRADGYDALLQRIEAAHSVSGSLVETMLRQTELLRTVDRQMGAPTIVDQMQAHLNTLSESMAFAVLPSTRKPIAEALAGAATLAAWQALDVGAADRAWRHYELAKSAAREADNSLYVAHAMGEQAYVLLDAGKSELAAELVSEARSAGGTRLSPRLTAWLHAAEAEMHAHAGRADECRRSLDLAVSVLPPGEHSRDPEMLSIFLNESHLGRWRGNALALIGQDEAVAQLRSALEVMDPTFTRAQADVRCDLAQAHAYRGEYDEAAVQLRGARRLANRTGSVRHLRRVDQITRKI
jgi:transcriptional regulator with XRE-family HTH domain